MAIKAESKVFKKASAENFKSILKQQKEDESDPKFAISDSLQEYQSQLEKSAGYTSQAKLNKAEIRQEIIDFVIYYPINELDALKGMDFDDAKTQQKTTEKTIKEYEGLFKKGIISEEEMAYIQETVGKTNVELKKILGLSTKLSLSFRDFKKELKPLKLAKRFGLTNVPIIGKRIDRAIESEERAEAKGLQTKRQLRKKESKGALKQGGKETGAGTSGGKEDIAKRATAKTMATGDFKTEDGGGDSEEATEQERESDKQFDTSSNLLEKIYEEQRTTNELLGKKKEDDKGFFEGIGSALLPLAALTGLGGIITSSITGLGSTLAGSMRSMLGLPPKAPKGPVGAKPKVLASGSSTKAVTNTTGTDKKKDLKKTKVKTGNIVKNNVKKGAKIAGKVAGGAARVAGRVFLPLAAVMSIFDAAKGVADAGELLDKEDGDLTFRDKASAGFGGFISGLTFGLVDKKKAAKWAAGDSDAPSTATQHDDLGLIEDMSKQKKIDKVEELKADSIEKLTVGDGSSTGNTIINNVDNSSSTSKTEYGSNHIGTKNSDSTVGDFSNIG